MTTTEAMRQAISFLDSREKMGRRAARAARSSEHSGVPRDSAKQHGVKAPAKEETMLRKHCCGSKCFPVCDHRKH